MTKKRLTRKLRVELGISKIINGQEYTFLDHTKNKKEALSSKKRFNVNPQKYPVKITKSKGEYKYEIWMKRRASKN